MTLSIFPHTSHGSRIAQLMSAAALGAFLGMTYLVVEQEIRASDDFNAPVEAAPVEVSEEEPHVGGEKATKPEAKQNESREGSRREWYERRKRRWVTPPKVDMDRGLPKQRRFKLS